MLLFGWIIYNGSNPNHWMQNENWNHNKINQKKSFKCFHFQFLASFNNFASFARLRCCFQAFVKHLSQTDTVLGLPSIITVERNKIFYFLGNSKIAPKIKISLVTVLWVHSQQKMPPQARQRFLQRNIENFLVQLKKN